MDIDAPFLDTVWYLVREGFIKTQLQTSAIDDTNVVNDRDNPNHPYRLAS